MGKSKKEDTKTLQTSLIKWLTPQKDRIKNNIQSNNKSTIQIVENKNQSIQCNKNQIQKQLNEEAKSKQIILGKHNEFDKKLINFVQVRPVIQLSKSSEQQQIRQIKQKNNNQKKIVKTHMITKKIQKTNGRGRKKQINKMNEKNIEQQKIQNQQQQVFSMIEQVVREQKKVGTARANNKMQKKKKQQNLQIETQKHQNGQAKEKIGEINIQKCETKNLQNKEKKQVKKKGKKIKKQKIQQKKITQIEFQSQQIYPPIINYKIYQKKYRFLLQQQILSENQYIFDKKNPESYKKFKKIDQIQNKSESQIENQIQIQQENKNFTQILQMDSKQKKLGKKYEVPVKLCPCCGYNGKRHLCQHFLCTKPCLLAQKKQKIRVRYYQRYKGKNSRLEDEDY